MSKHRHISLALLFVLIISSLSFAQKGTMETEEITSSALGGVTKNFLVYLPPSYTISEKEYPSFYVLHGLGMDYRHLQGMRRTLDRMIQDGEIGEMIAVFPDGDNSGYKGDYEPYIVSELVDLIDDQYRTISDRDSRGVTGHSMGGFGAMHLALKFPEVFSVAVPQAGAYSYWGGLQEDLDHYVDQPVRLDGIKIVHGRADAGAGSAVSQARSLVEKLTEEGIDHEYVEHVGGHRVFMEEKSLQFFSDRLHPLHEIARLRDGTSVTIAPGATVVGEPASLEVVVTLDIPSEINGALRGILLDLAPLGISSQLPLEHSGDGHYTLSHTITPSRSGRHTLPLIMETGFEWDIDGTRYLLSTVGLDVYLASDVYYVYQDQMESGWAAKVSFGELDLEASEVVYEGSHAQAVTLLKSGGNVQYTFADTEGFSTFGYTGLGFWINPGTASTEKAFVALRTSERAKSVKLGEDLGITLTPDMWQRISILLEDLDVVDTRLEAIRFEKVEGMFHVDDLAFVISEYQLSAPEATSERIKADGMMFTVLSVKTEPAVMVIEPDAPPTVAVDLTPIGGSPETRMFDGGTGGDKMAGDGIYTIRVTVPPEIANGLKDLVISATDSRFRVYRAHIPLVVLPPEDLYVYDDEIAPGWSLSTLNILSNPSAAAFVYEGKYSQEISVKRSSNFATYSWDDHEGFNAFGYTDLVFQVLVTEPEQDPLLILTPVTGDAFSYRLGDQLGELGIWQEIRIPLGGLAEADFMLKRFSLQRVDATLYIDDMRFVPEEVPEPSEPTAVEVSEGSVVPSGYVLSQNYPNPFNPETTIRYTLSETGAVRLSLYNVSGQLIRTLVDGERAAGSYSVTWDGRDDMGRDVASGVYVGRMEVNGFSAVRKLVLVR